MQGTVRLAECAIGTQVVEFVKNPEYSHFSRIIFDTAPTGHTLRLLTLPDFLDASLGAPCASQHQQSTLAPGTPGSRHSALHDSFRPSCSFSWLLLIRELPWSPPQ